MGRLALGRGLRSRVRGVGLSTTAPVALGDLLTFCALCCRLLHPCHATRQKTEGGGENTPNVREPQNREVWLGGAFRCRLSTAANTRTSLEPPVPEGTGPIWTSTCRRGSGFDHSDINPRAFKDAQGQQPKTGLGVRRRATNFLKREGSHLPPQATGC